MKCTLPFLVALCGLLGCGKHKSPSSTDVPSNMATFGTKLCADSVISDEGIGPLRIGTFVSDLKKFCSVLSDTVEIAQEGIPSRILMVNIGDDTLAIEADNGRVSRITVSQTRFRTADSLRVGVPHSQLLTLADVHGAVGENGLFVFSPRRCGLSFRVTDPENATPKEDWTLEDLRGLPAGTRVTEILIVRCRPAA
jgi:hypothetical protein